MMISADASKYLQYLAAAVGTLAFTITELLVSFYLFGDDPNLHPYKQAFEHLASNSGTTLGPSAISL